jgi:alpha-amylase
MGKKPKSSMTTTPVQRRLTTRRITIGATVLATVAAVTTISAVATASPKASPHPSSQATSGGTHDVLANLFEWNWKSVANECTTVLGPAGYAGVQVAPPQDSLKRTHLGDGSDTILHPWWEVYQPVDYNLTSRMGNEQQFKSMVDTCRHAGVKVYVDAVINHMTGQGELSYGGVSYTKYNYAGLYSENNFHKFSGDCPSASGGIEDFNNQQQVFNCELVGLSDLRTDTSYVRNRLAGYLNKLIGYGVSGFRVDAAKHIGQTDLAAIYAKLHNTKEGTRPYWALEVFGGGPGILSPQAFTTGGSVLGLDADRQIQAAFKSYPAQHVGSISTLKVFGAGSGLPPSNKALVFVQNHDTERNGDALNYKDGATNTLANEFVLAYGYGRPQVYSGFEWNVSDDSPPSDADGFITDTDCRNGWACVDRYTGVRNMVGWHNFVGSAGRSNWYDDKANVIAFSRGSRGWIALNNGTADKTITVQTGLPAGTYCDVIHATTTHGSCNGPAVVASANGKVTVTVGAKDAVAFDLSNLQ